MFRGKTTKFMPSHVQSAYIQNGMKLFSNITIAYLKEGDHDKITSLTTLMDDSLSGLLSSSDLEVQERASVMQQFVRYVKKHVQKGKQYLTSYKKFSTFLFTLYSNAFNANQIS